MGKGKRESRGMWNNSLELSMKSCMGEGSTGRKNGKKHLDGKGRECRNSCLTDHGLCVADSFMKSFTIHKVCSYTPTLPGVGGYMFKMLFCFDFEVGLC